MKKNTIKMPSNYKSMFTIEDMEAIHDFIKNNEDDVITDAVRALENVFDGEVLKSSARWCLNSAADGRLGSPNLDIVITAYILYFGEIGQEIECASVCLTDVWEINKSNWNEFKTRICTRHFTEVK